MARQLIYTSAPMGLSAGRTGFCTVARHRDLRDRLVSRIEKISVFPADWRPAPVICAFRWIDIGDARFPVLSRLVDAGHDYTHRTNFLAHHLILDPVEIAVAPRPADIFLRWDGWLNRWEKVVARGNGKASETLRNPRFPSEKRGAAGHNNAAGIRERIPRGAA